MPYLFIYLGLVFLKLVRFPGIREISWGWFILIPVLLFIRKIIGPILSWMFYVVYAWCALWVIAKIGLWIFS